MIVLYPGSFDPITLGHMDLITRAAKIMPELWVAVADNPYKSPLFTTDERIQLLLTALDEAGVTNVTVTAFSGLLAEFARKNEVRVLIRGVRDGDDFLNEMRYAWHNRLFDGNIDTIFLPCSPSLSFISSRMVREAATLLLPTKLNDAALAQLVPPSVHHALREKFIK